MALSLIPLDCALPALQAHLAKHVSELPDSVVELAVAELLEKCVKTGEKLVAFALLVGGRPSMQ